jgi:hypothetical protein
MNPVLGSGPLARVRTATTIPKPDCVLPPKAIHNARLLNLSLSRGFVLLFVLSATAWAVDPNRQITQ